MILFHLKLLVLIDSPFPQVTLQSDQADQVVASQPGETDSKRKRNMFAQFPAKKRKFFFSFTKCIRLGLSQYPSSSRFNPDRLKGPPPPTGGEGREEKIIKPHLNQRSRMTLPLSFASPLPTTLGFADRDSKAALTYFEKPHSQSESACGMGEGGGWKEGGI